MPIVLDRIADNWITDVGSLYIRERERGLMMARGLADNGAKVYIGGRRKDVVEKAAASYGKNAKGSIVA